MIKVFHKPKLPYLLILAIVVGAFLRFYKLDWGQGLFTHPDEYHIVGSVAQLSFPKQMHPHFFSYGTVTIYLIYFTQELIKSIFRIHNSEFPASPADGLILNSFLVGRFYSALFSTLTILVVYRICRTFLTTKLSLLGSLLVAITPGLIQQAHFATPESAQIFFLFSSLFFMLKLIQRDKLLYLILASIFLGFSLGVKVSSSVFFLPLIVAIAFCTSRKRHLRGVRSGLRASQGGELLRPLLEGDKATILAPSRWPLVPPRWMTILSPVFKFTIQTITSLAIAIVTFAIVAPYVFLDFPAFKSNLDYEGGLAIGKIPVFYTRQFIGTIPIIFHLEKILPYALGPTVLIAGIAGFFLTLIHFRGVPPVSHHLEGVPSATSKVVMFMFVITIAFLSLFVPNAFLFAKWTRFIASSFPFFAIFAAFSVQALTNKIRKSIYYLLIGSLVTTTALWTTAFFSIYLSPDIRITASEWLEAYAKPGSRFLVEGGNTVDLPLKGNFQRISLDFYALEHDPATREKIADALHSSDYFLIQSRRVFMNHQRLPHLYPKTARFYDALFSEKLGFEQVKTFQSYPKLEIGNWKLEIPDEGAEETWSVFDHPVIRVFKKNASLSREEYARFLEN